RINQVGKWTMVNGEWCLTVAQVVRRPSKFENAQRLFTIYHSLVVLATAVVLDYGLQNLVERDGGAKARERADLRDVGDAARHVLEALFVCLVVGNCNYLGLRAGQFLHAAREFHYRDLLVRADVEDLAHGLVPLHQVNQSADDITHEAEAARLLARAEDRDGPARQRLLDEGWDDHAVLPGLSGADGVEESDDDRRQLLLAPVGEREELVNRLRARVRPAPLRRRSHDEVSVLSKRNVVREAIDFGSRGEE